MPKLNCLTMHMRLGMRPKLRSEVESLPSFPQPNNSTSSTTSNFFTSTQVQGKHHESNSNGESHPENS